MNLKATIFILLMLPSLASAQWISDIITESDWEYYYINGYLDYNGFQLLREVAEGSVEGDTLGFMNSTFALTPADLQNEFDISGIRAGSAEKTPSPLMGAQWSGRLRLGSKIRNGTGESYLLAAAHSSKTGLYVKLEDDGQGSATTERRSVGFIADRYSLTLGNFAPDIGCGLSIGRFDYRPVSLESDGKDLNRLLFPDNSYYNGAQAVLFDNYHFIYSVKKYNDVYKNTFGSAAILETGAISLGITGAFTRLSSGKRSRTLGVGSIFVDLPENGAKAEVAYAESGPGISVQIAKSDYALRGWYYDDSFINLQCSGFSYPDYQSYTDENSEISFRQPQSGETGFYVRRLASFKTVKIGSVFEFWRNPRTAAVNYDNSVQASIPVFNHVESRLGYYFYEKNGASRNSVESGIRIINRYEIEMRVLVAVERNLAIKERSKFYIAGIVPISKAVSFAGRLRWRFDGQFDYFIEERAELSERFYMKATYRWNEDSGKDLGSLYAIMENRF